MKFHSLFVESDWKVTIKLGRKISAVKHVAKNLSNYQKKIRCLLLIPVLIQPSTWRGSFDRRGRGVFSLFLSYQRRRNDNRAEAVGKETERGRDCWGASKDFEILFPPEMAPPRPRYLRGGVAEYRNYLQSVTGLRGTRDSTWPSAPDTPFSLSSIAHAHASPRIFVQESIWLEIFSNLTLVTVPPPFVSLEVERSLG